MSGSKNTKTVTRQSAGRDIRNSPPGNIGSVGIIGDGTICNVTIQNLHVHFRFPMGEPEIDKGKAAMVSK
jgi:hypothetical protein